LHDIKVVHFLVVLQLASLLRSDVVGAREEAVGYPVLQGV
jgi:hypothetical protein